MMAAPSKKRELEQRMGDGKVEDDVVGSDEEWVDEMEDEEEEMEDEALHQTVQVEFEARSPEDHDFHGIRKLLQQLFLKANINLSQLTDTIISQNYVGSIIKQAYEPMDDDNDDDEDDDDDVFGLVSVVNITERQNLDCVQQLKARLLEKCKECEASKHEKLAGLLHDASQQIGLVLNERFINIPPQLALPAFESLWKEVERANKKKMNYQFNHLLMISKTYKFPQGVPQAQFGDRTFVNTEEEIFFQESSFSFQYSVASERDTGVDNWEDDEEDGMQPFRTVMIIDAEKLPTIMGKLKEALGPAGQAQ